MKKTLNIFLIAVFISSFFGFKRATFAVDGNKAETRSIEQSLLLTGFNLSIEDLVAMARSKVAVSIDPAAWERVSRSHDLLLKAAKEGKAVYGLNRGVGLIEPPTPKGAGFLLHRSP